MRTTSRVVTTALAVTPLLVAASVATANAAPTAHPSHTTPQASHPTPRIATAVRRQVAKDGTAGVVVALRGNAATAHPDTKSGKQAHAKAIAQSQSPVLSLLHSSARASHVHAYNTFNVISARVTQAGLAKLAASPDVATVAPNANIKLTPSTTEQAAAKSVSTPAVTPPAGVCSTTTPQLNPEGLQTTQTQSDDPSAKTARSLGATGAGVTVAFMAEGLDVNNPDFIRPDGSPVFTDYQDFTGDGTSAPTAGGEAFLDASSIAAQGNKTYNVQHYSALPTKGACKIRIEGVAPGVNLVGLKVFGENSLATTSNFLQAIDYAVNTDHVNVLSESFGSNPIPDTTTDVIRAADEAAVAAGTTVTVSSGDAGVTNTLGSPSTSPGVISTGATTDFRSYLQSSYGLSNAPGVKGYLSDNISSLSSGGTDQTGGTVDLVAPGDLNWALCTPDLQQYFDCSSLTGAPAAAVDSGGTSESAPLTAGGAALVIQAYRQTHNNQNPTPAVVKQLLVSTARDIGAPGEQQGAGELDTYRAVLAARSITGNSVTPAPQGDTFVTDTPQVDVTGDPGTAVTKNISVTNTGTTTQTITPSARTLGNYTPFAQRTFTMSKADSRIVDYLGYNDFYHKVTFTVPAGTDRLDAAIAFHSGPASPSPGRLVLVGPNGRYAGYTLPQGAGGYGDTEVAHPTAGTWTGYIFTRPKTAGGTFGRYVFGYRTASFAEHGTLSGALTLAPGQSGTVTYTTTTPVHPGDRTASVVLSSSAGGSTTIPVVLRSLAPVSTAGTPFTGTLTGGNGRASETGQTEYYSFDVASGAPELNAQVSLAKNADNPFYVSLIDPNGDQVGYGSNNFLSGLYADPTPELSGVSHVLNPSAGRWTIVINFAGFVSGTALAQRFSVLLDTGQNTPTATGLPTSTSTTLPAGQDYTAYVSVTNTTSAPEAYFADARTSQNTTYTLTGSDAALTLPLQEPPLWLVPDETSSVSGAFTSTKATEFDLAPAAGAFTVSGDPDVESNSGTSATATYTAPSVTSGLWSFSPQLIGPFGATAAQHATGTASMTATTKTFDRTITSSTHDLWLASVDENASTVRPVVVQPGKTGVIAVHIKPTGTAGSTASGTLYIDDLASVSPDGSSPNGNEVAALPYSYKIG